jgi:hypothetical protein
MQSTLPRPTNYMQIHALKLMPTSLKISSTGLLIPCRNVTKLSNFDARAAGSTVCPIFVGATHMTYLVYIHPLFCSVSLKLCRSQWPSGLRRGSAAARLLGLRVRIPTGHCLSLVSVVCYQVEVSESGWSLVQRIPTDCGVSECDREASIMMRPWPTGGCYVI